MNPEALIPQLGPTGAIVALVVLLLRQPQGPGGNCDCKALEARIVELQGRVEHLAELTARLDERVPSQTPRIPPMRSTLPTPRDR
jgi:hypothetical protein